MAIKKEEKRDKNKDAKKQEKMNRANNYVVNRQQKSKGQKKDSFNGKIGRKFKYWLFDSPLRPLFLILFAGWIAFLIFVSLNANRSVEFFDVLGQENLNSSYDSKIPLSRYFLEPFSGVSFILGPGFDWIVALLFSFLILRAIYHAINFIQKKKNKDIPSESLPINMFRESGTFTLKLSWIILFTIIGYLGILYWTKGFISVANQYNPLLHIFAALSVLLFVGRYVRNLSLVKNGKAEKLRRKLTKKKNLLFKGIKGLFHEIWSLLIIICIIASFLITLTTLNLPTQRLITDLETNDQGEQVEFLYDFHVHTSESDGFLTPQRRVDWYIDQGIAGAAFSDHHNIDGSLAAMDYVSRKDLDFHVLLSQEFTDDPEGLHLNVYGIDEDLTPKDYFGSPGPNLMNCEEMIKYVKENGGYVTVNHYGKNSTAPFTYNQLMDWGVDGFEILNDGDIYPDDIREFCLENNLACMGGSDIHGNYELNTFVKIKFEDPSNRSLDAIFTQLKKNEHEVVQLNLYQDSVNADLWGLRDFVNYMLSLNFGQLISWWTWTFFLVGGIYIFNEYINNLKIDAENSF